MKFSLKAEKSNSYCGGNDRHGRVALYHICLIYTAIGSPVWEGLPYKGAIFVYGNNIASTESLYQVCYAYAGLWSGELPLIQLHGKKCARIDCWAPGPGKTCTAGHTLWQLWWNNKTPPKICTTTTTVVMVLIISHYFTQNRDQIPSARGRERTSWVRRIQSPTISWVRWCKYIDTFGLGPVLRLFEPDVELLLHRIYYQKSRATCKIL